MEVYKVLHSFCAPVVVALFLAAPSDAALFSDSFTTGDGTGTVGGSVNGQMTETGGATWIGNNSWQYTAGGTLIVGSSTGGPVTRILSAPFSHTAGQMLTVAAGILPPTTTDPQDWSAIGFSKNAPTTFDSGYFTSGVGQLWMALRKNGNYFVIARHNIALIADVGVAPGYNPNGLNLLELSLDTATNIASAKINGVTVLPGYDLDTISFTPDIQEAGFHFHRITQAVADNFSLTIVPDPVPEPASLTLLLFTISLAAFGAGRRKRS